jgi:O-antigen ligase
VRWLQKRKFSEAVLDAHSLYLETAAELGLPGLAALAALFAGLALAARRALRRDAALAAGLIAGVVAWAGQSAVDWLWEMPAVTLIALVLAGALVAAAEATGQPDRPA